MTGARTPVTVGLPVFNGAATVARAIASVRAQSYPHWRLVISDNGSTDGSADIARQFAALDDRIEYRRREQTVPAMENFAGLVEGAEDGCFVFVAADDYWAPEFLELAVEALDACPQRSTVIGRVQLGAAAARGAFPIEDSDPVVRVRRFLEDPSDNSRFYGVHRSEVLADAFRLLPKRYVHAIDWYVSAFLLRAGMCHVLPRTLIYRDAAPPGRYTRQLRASTASGLARHLPLWRLCRLLWQVMPRELLVSMPALIRLNLRLVRDAKTVPSADHEARS